MVAPTKATISALGQRDLSPDGQQCYAMVLEYTFKQTEIGEVTPRLAALNEYLYESAYESQMYMIFDANKKVRCNSLFSKGFFGRIFVTDRV